MKDEKWKVWAEREKVIGKNKKSWNGDEKLEMRERMGNAAKWFEHNCELIAKTLWEFLADASKEQEKHEREISS